MLKKSKKRKLCAYVDESGQDTKGLLFVVSVLILEEEKEMICAELEKIESESGKKNSKWNKARPEFRRKYIESIAGLEKLKNRLFYDIFSDTKKYVEMTSFATAKAILKKAGNDKYTATIFVDGFKKKEIDVFSRGFRDLHIRTRKIRGVKRDENSAFIRLVDAICGLVRDMNDGQEWAKKAIGKLKMERVLNEL